jgi:hypothetical protein
MRLHYSIFAAVAFCALKVCAVDGIAVREHWQGSRSYNDHQGYGNCIRRSIIKSDMVVKQDTILFSDTLIGDKHAPAPVGQFRWVTINVQGTHVAFFRYGVTSYSGSRPDQRSYHVSVMDVNGGEVVDVAGITSGNVKGYLTWASNGYVYYNTGGRSESTSRNIYKVKVGADGKAEGTPSKIVTLNQNIWQWTVDISTGTKMCVDVNDSHTDIVTYILPGNGKLPGSGLYGCNNSVSPSGTYLNRTTDAGHYNLGLNLFDDLSGAGSVGGEQPNEWVINSPFEYHCGDKIVTAGAGYQTTHFSVNSDKWISYGLGWPSFGRSGDCSANQVLVNWVDKKAIMASFNPRHCRRDDRIPACTEHDTIAPTQQDLSGGFWISAPQEDINEDLRQYISPDHWIYKMEVGANGSWSVPRRLSPSIRMYGGRLVIEGGSESIRSVDIFDLAGRRVFFGSSDRAFSAHLHAGTYIARMHTHTGVIICRFAAGR